MLKERENISELSSDKSSENDNSVDFEFSDIVNGDYVVVQYARKCNVVYYAAVVTSVNNDEMFTVSFFKCNGKKKISFFMKIIMMKLVLNLYFKNFHYLKSNKNLDQVHYYFNCVDLNIELQ